MTEEVSVLRGRGRITASIALLLLLSLALNAWLFVGRPALAPEAGGGELYVCPMHPQVVQDHPGDCPICGMKLVRRGVDSASDVLSDSLAATVALSPSQQIMANVAVAAAETGHYRYQLSLPGRVVPVEGNQTKVSVKAAGRIERLHVSTTGESVRRGQPLFEYYSPGIGAANRELLLAHSSTSGQKHVLVNAARAKLLSLGLTDKQIEQMKPPTPPSDTVVFTSPISGFVMEKMAKEGEWMKPGANIYEIADLSTVWVEGVAYESDLRKIRLGKQVTVSSSSHTTEKFSGEIIWIAPALDRTTRTLPFRISLRNDDLKLRPEMYVTVRLVDVEDRQVVLLPEDAILQLGERQVAYVEVRPGHFAARDVVAGTAEKGRVPVYSGIAPGEMVVVSGGYLIDSDAQIKRIGQAPHGGHGHVETAGVSQGGRELFRAPERHSGGDAAAHAGEETYVCTMCPDVVSSEPGRCPECGMELVKKQGTDD
ncbi:MAG: hypothetical protein AMJ46_02230 [Latescibacteria bacterium DG_63]|nr:MAG: hypothetical protein AMJ46_02230 [Latescibacteria bacterium DG_63]